MKTYKIRGQISLELIMLILVALLSAVVVGVTIPNNLVNITSVE
ncbi:MAG TPA: class III signal peptide-containing protein, partial [Methanothermococcus okinawensis]|nr:class III signal peptide-containing protein [Methanothermococcus okinawensis]